MLKIIFCFIFALSLLYSNERQIQQREFTNEQQHLKQLQENMPNSNINLQPKSKHEKFSLILNEKPCFIINDINLTGNNKDNFSDHLKKVLRKLNFQKGQCLGKESIAILHSAFSNEIISSGLITTSVIIPNQNIKTERTLTFEVLEGKIDQILINESNSTTDKISVFMAFGGNVSSDDLNLRDIEQALEVFQNSSNAQVGVELIPSLKPNFTNINITKQKSFPIIAQLSFDNSGSDATGKYKGDASVQGLNLLGLNEILYLSYAKNIFSGEHQRVNNESENGGNDSIYYGFTLPFGRISLDFNEYKYNYDQAIAGAYGVYKYSGESKNRNLTLNYLYHRNQISKNSIYLRLWERENKNFIQDYELDNQRRKTAGYEIGLNSQFYIENGSIVLGASYKKGTGARGSLRALEEDYNGGTSRFEKYILNFGFRKSSSNIPLTYDLKFQAMYNGTPLTMQERISLGGYYTIRGFDGEMSLVGDRGFLIRNTLEYDYINNHKTYFAFDIGKVTPQAGLHDSKNALAGVGIGLKGNFKPSGSLGYDIFVGKALSKPEYFETDKVALNFGLTYTF
ncbi:ShlB/FhaC/HecB family hemolysin secretion/activation protein [Campylobacter sputorum]|uniref:ShlB/FhaC/HecB family hemolysin secretion/activation protein n=1 Tax=Campylobacter sputorum TaxID=206 RepID=UPI001E560212|nr:ShlB/FhaC/HecB family hemolysin secretion/activation protein [Campylobacter sputorum]